MEKRSLNAIYLSGMALIESASAREIIPSADSSASGGNAASLSAPAAQYFNKDLVERRGSASKEDLLVTPYLNNGISGYGDRISIERKSGKQIYTGAHFKEAIQHAIEKGATMSLRIME
jgi:hypothetical protein